ncbi:APC family permease [Nocardioides sp. KIGAM211]|uniref:APC family permease n=1 Tax=Nocardioides luti TaxID=2761101 RepID=A0A7X0RG30_9ACTN|nr:APC family permease [Nocardioides luti]MBB6627520.1 APC family permease [Nocardioides luti]
MFVFIGFLPACVLLGNGVGTPVAFLAGGLVVALLAVGLIKMSDRLDKPGGFYAMITAGLGKTVGLAAGFTALTTYFLALIAAYALGGIALATVITGVFDGPDIAWQVFAFVMLVFGSILGYFNINVSAKVLTYFLAAELLLILTYDISVLAQGGANGIGFDSFTGDQISSGSLPIAFLFAIGLFGGFEATVIFRDEVRNPKRTIPTATYGVITLMVVLYTLTAWCFINAYGADVIMDVVTNDPAGASSASVRDYVGTFAYDIATILLFTSALALVLAAHNITSRYLFNLGADRIFPRKLGEAHPRYVSPHRASIVVSIATLGVLVFFVVADPDPGTLYARLAGLFSYALVMLLTIVALAIVVFLLRDRAHGQATAAVCATSIALVALFVTFVLATKNFTVLTGATGTPKAVLLGVIFGVTLLGLVWAIILKCTRPEVYARIGRE